MPHFGLIAEGIPISDEMLIRAKLHFQAGDIRREKGQTADAIASYYDAFTSAMKRMFLSKEMVQRFVLPHVDDLEDDKTLFIELKGAGVIDESFSLQVFLQFQSLLEAAFADNVEDSQIADFIKHYRKVMTQLDVIPISADDPHLEHSVTL